ncbi:hypothetical protein HD554DRAFT_2174837 [Boletus coccyginus]|nr:hypothetical protein HD554DRAFT_2174837 [Boletus coccyginus]
MASDPTSNSRASVQSESSPTTESAARSIVEPSVPSLHQCLTSLALQVQQLRASQTEKTKMRSEAVDWRLRGRAIRRLVTLSDSVTDILAEADRRGASEAARQTFSEEENWYYRCYKELVIQIPELMSWIDETEDMNELDTIVKKLTEGADSARSDDTCHMKSAVVGWIGEPTPPNPRLYPHDKFGRGFQNNTTARLLCPVEYDWDCDDHRNKIRDWHPDFLVTANSWPRFLYENNHYDPSDPAKGLFKGSILLKAFKLIFTSPTSVDVDENQLVVPNVLAKCRRGERRTRPTVATLLKMKRVTPQAIAYIAVQVRFALSSCGTWRLVDELFNHRDFYNAIIRWFEEEMEDVEERAFVDGLLLWWNREAFGRKAVLEYNPQNIEKAAE